jgi:hypothetical protein
VQAVVVVVFFLAVFPETAAQAEAVAAALFPLAQFLAPLTREGAVVAAVRMLLQQAQVAPVL